MEYDEDPAQASGSKGGIISEDEVCPTCHGNVMTCDCIDDAAFQTYLKRREQQRSGTDRYKTVNVKKKYL